MTDTNQEGFIELKEFESKDLELDDDEIDYIRRLDPQPLTLDTISRNRIRLKAGKYVGQVVPSNKIIKMIPKIGDVGFFGLLLYTEDMPKWILDEISTAKGGRTLVDVLARLFVKIIKEIIETGLYRKYYRVSEQTHIIRGRLLLAQTIRAPYNLDGKVWCEYNKIGYNVLENQAILYCTMLLLNSIKDIDTWNELLDIRKTLLSQEVSLKVIHSYELQTLNLHRLNEHYEMGLRFCKFILDGTIGYQEFSMEDHMPTLTWYHNMERLFEKFVTKILQKNYEPTGFKIRAGKHIDNVLELVKGAREPPDMIPDNVIRKNERDMLILDTKYKEKGAGSADFYQATAYSLELDCNCVLLVPEIENKIQNQFRILDHPDLHVYEKSIKFPEEKDDVHEIIENLEKQVLDIVNPFL